MVASPAPMDQERRLQTICLLIITAVAVGFALFFLRSVLIPFVLALFLWIYVRLFVRP